MADDERIAQMYYDGLQVVKRSVGKLDNMLKTKDMCVLPETNDLLNQILNELNKRQRE